jgi:sugar O-acyltransferase (sialic acid O-acetyltransferase NeuD family)
MISDSDGKRKDAGRAVCVIGAGGHGKVVIRTLQELGYTVEAVFDDSPERIGARLFDVPVVGPLPEIGKRGRVPAVIAVGDNAARKDIAERFDLEWLTIVHPRAFVDPTVRIGQGTLVFAGAVVQPDSILGEHVIINTGASIDHDCTIGDFAHIAPGVHLAGGVSVGEGAFLGTGALAIVGREIGQWTTVGAGATVTTDLPADVVAVGAPARAIRRNQGVNGRAVRAKAGEKSRESLPSEKYPKAKDSIESQAGSLENRIYLSSPHMSGEERNLLLEAFDSNWIAPLGPQVDAFEREFAEKVGVPHAVALSSGTAALHLALQLLGVGPGDEVATSSLTFAASANAIRYVDATPVFIDSEPSSWNMDPELLAEELEAAVRRGKPVKAVLAVDVFGQCADYEPILKICRFYDVPLIEDAAEALGATYQGRAAGSFGRIGCYSFNGNKIITTGGGGMLVTDRRQWAERARFLASQARDPAPHYEHSEIGYNYRMSNLLAAVGRGQLRVLDERVAERRANFRFYEKTLADLPGIRFMPELAKGRSTRWLTCILVDPEQFGATREDIRLALEQENIESRPVWKPMHMQPVHARCRVRGRAVSEEIFRNGLCLPSGSCLSREQLMRVVECVRSVAPARSSPAGPLVKSER